MGAPHEEDGEGDGGGDSIERPGHGAPGSVGPQPGRA